MFSGSAVPCPSTHTDLALLLLLLLLSSLYHHFILSSVHPKKMLLLSAANVLCVSDGRALLLCVLAQCIDDSAACVVPRNKACAVGITVGGMNNGKRAAS